MLDIVAQRPPQGALALKRITLDKHSSSID
jgi:hypothetical protein